MSLIINGNDLTQYFIDYTPIFEPGWKTTNTNISIKKQIDYGQKYDMFKTRITLAMPVNLFGEFINSISEIPSSYNNGTDLYPIQFSTTEQIFIPGQNITTGTCEFISTRQMGYYDFKMNWCVYELMFSYSIPQIITGDYTSHFQDSFNKSLKTPVNNRFLFSHQVNYVTGGRFSQSKHITPPRISIDCSQDLVKPYEINQILNFYRINRSSVFQLTINDSNIFGTSGVSDVVVSDFQFERQPTGFYQINYIITKNT